MSSPLAAVRPLHGRGRTGRRMGRQDGPYDLMLGLSPNPAVALNRAVAVGQRDGPAAALAALDGIDRPGRSHLWHAARADPLTRLGRTEEAAAELDAALATAPTELDRRLLARRRVAV